MSLFIRISDNALDFAEYEASRPTFFEFEQYHVRPQASLTVNIREAVTNVPFLQHAHSRVEVLVGGSVTLVPLAEFQEEDVETVYRYCITERERMRIFYDTIPSCNAVLLFSLSEVTCRALEEAFGEVRYASTLTALLGRFAGKGLGSATGKRIFVYTHDGRIDLAVMESSRLIMFNTYTVKTLTDVSYYVFNAAGGLGIDLADAPVFVAGSQVLRDPVVGELERYASRVYPINPSAEFNRHPVSTHEGVAYDMMCALLK